MKLSLVALSIAVALDAMAAIAAPTTTKPATKLPQQQYQFLSPDELAKIQNFLTADKDAQGSGAAYMAEGPTGAAVMSRSSTLASTCVVMRPTSVRSRIFTIRKRHR